MLPNIHVLCCGKSHRPANEDLNSRLAAARTEKSQTHGLVGNTTSQSSYTICASTNAADMEPRYCIYT